MNKRHSHCRVIFCRFDVMKYYLFIFFIIAINLSNYNTTCFVIYNIILSSCIATAIYLLYVLRKTINNYVMNSNIKNEEHIEPSIKTTSIDNIG